MCSKLHLLTICASCSGQLPSYLAEPIICYNWLGATRIHRRLQPKEMSQVIPRWWWWWVVVVVALVLYQCLNQSVLLLDQLGDLWRENKLGVASRRHLKGFRKDEKLRKEWGLGRKHYPNAHETNALKITSFNLNKGLTTV